MIKYNLSKKKPFDVLNLVGNINTDSNIPHVLLFGSYKGEKTIGKTPLEADSFYGDDIIRERVIWSAVSCLSGYRNKKRKYRDYGVIMQTLPIDRNLECYMEDEVKTRGPYYFCNPLMVSLVLAIVPGINVRQALHSLALRRASDFLEREEMVAHVGGDCDRGAHYYHERHLNIKRVRDFISGQEYTDMAEILQSSYDKIDIGMEI